MKIVSSDTCTSAASAPRGSAASPPATGPPRAPADTAAPAVPIIHPAAEFVKTRFDDYMSRAEKKDYIGKAKNSSIKASSPLASQNGNGTPAHTAATFPSTQYTQGIHYSTALHPFNTGMVPPPNPMPWAAGGPFSGTQGQTRFSNPFSGFQSFIMPQQSAVPHWLLTSELRCHSMPQQSAVPPWLHSQWTALP